MERVYPYDDEYMTYNYRLHRYELTAKAVLEDLGENLDTILNTDGDDNPSTLSTRFLKEVSETWYNVARYYAPNPDWVEYQLAKNPNLRDFVYSELLSTVKYRLVKGLIWVSDINGSIKDTIERLVNPLTKSNLENEGLLYCGMIYLPDNVYRRGY